MTGLDDIGNRLATAAFACGVIAFPLWLLSFSWVPFVLAGHEVGPVPYIILAGEVGALVAALLAIGLGIAARKRAPAGNPDYRRASRGLVVGTIALVLIVGFNALGWAFA